MSFLEHLGELRRRLLRAAVVACCGFGVALYFADPILRVLLWPIEQAMGPLAVIRPAEAFMNKMKAALVGGLVVALPALLYELWSFIAPGLYRRERRWVGPVVIGGTLLFAMGVAFSYLVALPTAVRFLAAQSRSFRTMVTVDSAFAFSTKLLLGSGVVFEMPLVVFALARLDVVSARWLWRKFDIAIFVIFVIAAVVTPTPDVITQSIFALPMIGLYLVSIGVAWWARRRAPEPPAGGD